MEWLYYLFLFLLETLDYIGNILFLSILIFLFLNKSVIVRMTYLLVLTLVYYSCIGIAENVVEYFHDYQGCYPLFPHPVIGWSKSLLSSTLIVFSIILLEKRFQIYFFFKEIFLVLFMTLYIPFLSKWVYVYDMSFYEIYEVFHEMFFNREVTFFCINFLVLLWVFKSIGNEKK